MDISATDDGIMIHMEDYINSLEDIKDICRADRDKSLTKAELKEYRKVTGKLSWLANSTQPDLSYIALSMSKKNISAKISDLKNVSRVLKKPKNSHQD